MPAKKNTYKIDGKKYKDWPSATARAVELSLQQESNQVTIVETNPNSGAVYLIGITAVSEKA